MSTQMSVCCTSIMTLLRISSLQRTTPCCSWTQLYLRVTRHSSCPESGPHRSVTATRSASMYANCCIPTQASNGHLMLVSDLDLTMVDHKDSTHAALLNFNLLWAAEYAHNSQLVYSTGRSMERYLELQKDVPLLTPQVLILSVGTEIRLGPSMKVDEVWAHELDDGWDRDVIVEEALKIPNIRFQEEPDQGSHKVSFKVDRAKGEEMQKMLSARLLDRGLRVRVLYSSGIDLDVLPHKAGKGQALAYLLERLIENGIAHKNVLVCGDSGNDIDLFSVKDVYGVIVSNAQEELLRWHQHHESNANIFQASQRCAGGIMEALQHFRFGSPSFYKENVNQDLLPVSDGNQLSSPQAVHREVVQFSVFMLNSLLGEVPNSESSFARIAGIINVKAKVILPEGVELTGEELLYKMKEEHGSMKGSGLQIWLDKLAAHRLAEGVYLATWQFWERLPGREKKGYHASAVLQSKVGALNGLEWLHFHQTILSTTYAKKPQS